jgi:hypothetical protein
VITSKVDKTRSKTTKKVVISEYPLIFDKNRNEKENKYKIYSQEVLTMGTNESKEQQQKKAANKKNGEKDVYGDKKLTGRDRPST